MAKYLIEDTTLTNLAGAIRLKTESQNSLNPNEMISAILSINSSASSSIFYISEQVTVDQAISGNSITLISNNSMIAENRNNSKLFIIITPDDLESIDSSNYSNYYQWTMMSVSNKPMVTPEDESYIWYGIGIYLMIGKGTAYPSTLEIPNSLNQVNNSNCSYVNITENGDVNLHIYNYDVLAPGQYTITIGLL